MDALVEFLMHYGLVGMTLAAFLAGTVIPFNAELVMAGLSLSGLPALPLILCGTLGSVAGCMVNYSLGYLGKMEWLQRIGVSQGQLDKAYRFVQGKGAWMAVFTFLPLIGNAIGITLGLMRANKWIILIALLISRSIIYSFFALGPHLFLK